MNRLVQSFLTKILPLRINSVPRINFSTSIYHIYHNSNLLQTEFIALYISPFVFSFQTYRF